MRPSFGLPTAARGCISVPCRLIRSTTTPAGPPHWPRERDGFHLPPSNVCLMLVPLAPTLGIALALLLIRSTLAQMDVPARTSYVMAVVQYVFDSGKAVVNGRTSRPLMRSQAASVVRASAIPWPSSAASISMLAWFNTGPWSTSAPTTAAASSHFSQFFRSSRCSSGSFNRSEGCRKRRRPLISLGLQTGNSASEHKFTASSAGQLPSPCRTARSTSSWAKST
jgi:hypothetical protein